MRSKAFTLVELLIVIAILAVLIAMLLPVLNKARRAANSVRCMANLRQVAQFQMIYAAHYDGTLMPKEQQLPGAWIRWQMQYAYLYAKTMYNVGSESSTSMTERKAGTTVLECPEDYYSSRLSVVDRSGPGMTYTYNGYFPKIFWIPPARTGRFVRLSRVRRPSEIIWFTEKRAETPGDSADANWINPDNYNGSWKTDGKGPWAYHGPKKPGMRIYLDSNGWQHRNGEIFTYTMCIFVDGHVEPMANDFLLNTTNTMSGRMWRY